jgi:hypothetical protein
MSSDRLSEAYQFIEADKLAEARQILEPMLAQDRDNVDAWWLYAHAVTSLASAREALQNVMRLDPQYPGAADLLQSLEDQETREFTPIAAPSISPISAPPPPTLPDAFPDFDESDMAAQPKTRQPQAQSSGLFRFAAIVVVVLLVLGILALLLPSLTGGNQPAATPVAQVLTPDVAATEAATEVVDDIALTATAMIAGAIQTEEMAQMAETEEAVVETAEAAETQVSEDEPTEIAADETEDAPLPTATDLVETSEAAALSADETEAVDEVNPALLTATAIVERATALAEGAEESATEAADSVTLVAVQPTETSMPTSTPTEAELLASATAEEAEMTEAAITDETETEEAAEPEPTEGLLDATAVATQDATPAAESTDVVLTTDEAQFAYVADALEGFYTVPDDGIGTAETSGGNTLLASVCSSSATQQLRQDLAGVMRIMAGVADRMSDDIEAVGARMVNCETQRLIRIIVVDRESALSFAGGTLDVSAFEQAWQPL